MKKLTAIFIALMLTVLIGCNVVVYSDINDYRGSVILKITPDSAGRIRYDEYALRTPVGRFVRPSFDPIYATIFHVGDTIK